MYAVDTFHVSDYYDPFGGAGYIYNHNMAVTIATLGNNYGWSSFPGGSVTWNSLGLPGNPNYRIDVDIPIYEDDPNGIFALNWGTATCANDVVSGQVPNSVPEPTTLLLLGCGIVGLAGFERRRFKK